MTEPSPDVLNVMGRENLDQSQTVAYRIKQRLKVLEAWLSDEIPSGKTIPRSLNAVRKWDDGELGISPIHSPNDFTTTHAEHGHSVKQIGDVLSKLASRYGKPKKTVSKSSPVKVNNHGAYERALTETVSQWHSERDQHLREQRRADAAEIRSSALLDENAKKDRQIADLRRQLSTKSGLRVVE